MTGTRKQAVSTSDGSSRFSLARWWHRQTRLSRWLALDFPRTTTEFSRRVALVVFPALLGPIVLFLVGPHTVYAGNRAEFGVTFAAIAFPRLLALTVVSWTVLVAIGCVLALVSARFTRAYAALLFAIGMLAWVQGNLLVGDYGLLTGEELDLARYAGREPYELWLWGGSLGLAVLFARRVSAIAPAASKLFVVLQAVLLAVSLVLLGRQSDAEPRFDDRAWRPPREEIYQLSRDRNVIHVVLDGYLSEIFGEFLQNERAVIERDFSRFVYFADHLGAFQRRGPAWPAMLSGVAYRNELPFREFQQKSIEERSLFTVLARNGFRVHSITFHHREHPPPAFPGGEVVRYSVPTPYGSYEEYVEFAAAQLLDLALFRHVPHAFKTHVYNHDMWLLQSRYTERDRARRLRSSNHVAFFDELTGRLTVTAGRPVYAFIHVAVPHPPFALGADCSFTGRKGTSRAAYTAQARCGVAVIQRLLDRLRALDVYDRSVIVVTSDHGWHVPRGNHPLRGVTSPAGNLEFVASEAMPLLAIKPADATGPLRISRAPTAITDIPATVLDLLGLPNDAFPGELVFRIDERGRQSRVFAHHTWSNAGWRLPYFDVLRLFSVDGPVLEPSAWKFQRAIFEPSDNLEEQLERHQAGLSAVQRGTDGSFRWVARTSSPTFRPTPASSSSRSGSRRAPRFRRRSQSASMAKWLRVASLSAIRG